MRLLLVANTAASMVWFREPLMRALVARGHRVWVAAPDGWGVDRIVATGCSFVPLFQTQGWSFGAAEALAGSYTHPLRDAETVRDLRRVCRVVRPGLVLSYTHKMAMLTPWAARAAGVPKVHGMITGLGYANLKGGLKQAAVRAAYHASIATAAAVSDSIILLNQDNLDECARVVPQRKLYLMDGEGVDTERFEAPPPTWERGRATFVLLARLVGYKGVREYAAAARRVRQRWPEARFLLAGAADPRHPAAIPAAEIEGWVREGIIEHVGHVDDVRPLLAAASALVLPSFETEGLPMSIMEAMAASRPIVTTTVPGNRETVQEGRNGFLVPPQDVDALAAALEKLVANPALGPSMGAESRVMCLERFDHRTVNAALMDHLGV
jgi:glycosyltransferase involved in cell wall biosynthesis